MKRRLSSGYSKLPLSSLKILLAEAGMDECGSKEELVARLEKYDSADSKRAKDAPAPVLDVVPDCPICMTTLLPPIWQCPQGHTVCDVCSKQIDKCGECRSSMEHKVRNRLVESMLERIEQPCGHAGCLKSVKFPELRAHRDVCNFRPLTCHVAHCNKEFEAIEDLCDHLVADHKCFARDVAHDGSTSFRPKKSTDMKKTASTWQRVLLWDGHAFLLNLRPLGPSCMNITLSSIYLGKRGFGVRADLSISRDNKRCSYSSLTRNYRTLQCDDVGLVLTTKDFYWYGEPRNAPENKALYAGRVDIQLRKVLT